MMRRALRAPMRSLLGLGLMVTSLAAQERGATPLERGIAAYAALDFTATIVHLRSALALPGAALIPDSVQAAMLGYLGAAEFMSGRVQAARDAFRDALQRAPLFRLDTLVFPPLLTEAFESLRSETLFVTITMMPDGAVPSRGTSRGFLLHASFPHRAIVVVEFESGRRWTGLYDGEIRDSLRVRWRDADDSTLGDSAVGDAASAVPVEFTVEVISLSARGRMRRVRIPFRVEPVANPGAQTATISRP